MSQSLTALPVPDRARTRCSIAICLLLSFCCLAVSCRVVSPRLSALSRRCLAENAAAAAAVLEKFGHAISTAAASKWVSTARECNYCATLLIVPYAPLQSKHTAEALMCCV